MIEPDLLYTIQIRDGTVNCPEERKCWNEQFDENLTVARRHGCAAGKPTAAAASMRWGTDPRIVADVTIIC